MALWHQASGIQLVQEAEAVIEKVVAWYSMGSMPPNQTDILFIYLLLTALTTKFIFTTYLENLGHSQAW